MLENKKDYLLDREALKLKIIKKAAADAKKEHPKGNKKTHEDLSNLASKEKPKTPQE